MGNGTQNKLVTLNWITMIPQEQPVTPQTPLTGTHKLSAKLCNCNQLNHLRLHFCLSLSLLLLLWRFLLVLLWVFVLSLFVATLTLTLLILIPVSYYYGCVSLAFSAFFSDSSGFLVFVRLRKNQTGIFARLNPRLTPGFLVALWERFSFESRSEFRIPRGSLQVRKGFQLNPGLDSGFRIPQGSVQHQTGFQ